MLDIFRSQKKGEADGFACVKVTDEDSHKVKYRLRRLTSGHEYDFITEKSRPCDFKETFEFERFVFSSEILRFAEEVMDEAMCNPDVRSLFLDEIGALELQGRGFSELIQRMLRSDKDLYLCVNQRHAEAIQKKFKFSADHCI